MLSVKSLLGLECFRRITLEAGKGGLHRRISWPNIAQTASIREWLVGGDVILMSGVGLDHSAGFLNDLIQQAIAGVGLPAAVRGEQLTLADFAALAAALDHAQS